MGFVKEEGAGAETQQKDRDGLTTFQLAKKEGREEIANLLQHHTRKGSVA